MSNIFGIEPSVISRDLSSKSFLFFGAPKTGKTTTAVKFPKHLLLAFERGYNMINGVMPYNINRWSDALTAKKGLLKDAKEVAEGKKTETDFKSIIIDTATIAYDMCEKHILDKEGMEYLDETPNKRGYKSVQKEFDNFFQELVKAGYTIIAICHVDTKQVKENGVKYEVTQPKIDKRGLAVLSGLCDIIGYIAPETQEDGSEKTMLVMRGRQDLVAGSRSPYTSEKIEFSYDNLLADMKQAMDRQASEGAIVVDTPTKAYEDKTTARDYKVLQKEIGKIGNIIAKATDKETVTEIIEKYLGRDTEDKVRTVSACTSAQADILELILADLEDKVVELGIE